jgi:hypothetical protein
MTPWSAANRIAAEGSPSSLIQLTTVVALQPPLSHESFVLFTEEVLPRLA